MAKNSKKRVVAKKKAAPKKKVAKALSAGRQVPSTRAHSSVGIVPLSDRVIVRPLTEEESGTKSPSGIIIPDTVSKEKPEQGIVVAVGPGKYDEDGVRRIPVSVSVGDRVMFSKYGFDEVKVGGKEYFIVPEGSVLAIINE
jgi:chaperonin GroES